MAISDEIMKKINKYIRKKEVKERILDIEDKSLERAEAIREIGIAGDKGLKAEAVLKLINENGEEFALNKLQKEANKRVDLRKIYMELINEEYIESEENKKDLEENNSDIVEKAKTLDAESIRQLKIIGSRGLKSEGVLYVIDKYDSSTALKIIKEKAEERVEYKKLYHELVEQNHKKNMKKHDGIEDK